MRRGIRNLLVAVALGGAVLLTVLVLVRPESEPDTKGVEGEPHLLAGKEAKEAPGRPAMGEERAPESAGAARTQAERLATNATDGKRAADLDAPSRGAEPGKSVGRKLDADALLEAGISSVDIQSVLQHIAAAEPSRAALLRAMPEATPNERQDLRRELREIDEALEEQVGSDNYDRALYAARENNRVRVWKLIVGAPGEAAGLMPGDILISYNGRSIYSPELFHSLSGGAAALGTVSMEYRRAGEVFTTTIKAGAAGTFLESFREPPGGN